MVWVLVFRAPRKAKTDTHTHTETDIDIYIYICDIYIYIYIYIGAWGLRVPGLGFRGLELWSLKF